jgi:two-component system sensor histidine kinase AlgZ
MCFIRSYIGLHALNVITIPAGIAMAWALAFDYLDKGTASAFVTSRGYGLVFLMFKAYFFTAFLSWVYLLSHRPLSAPLPELEEANLQHLGAAIRPHFFFNALNAVMGLIRVNPKQAEAVLQDTAELFRSVMAQHESRLVTLATELETCQQYARIEQARLAQRLVLEWHIDEALLAVSVPPFSLQPLIENAIRHGIEPLAKGGKVVITAQRFEQQLVLRVTNPVVSELERYSATKAKQHNGIALNNITQRLALMYDQAAQFEHGIVEGRYEAQMNLPLEFAT